MRGRGRKGGEEGGGGFDKAGRKKLRRKRGKWEEKEMFLATWGSFGVVIEKHEREEREQNEMREKDTKRRRRKRRGEAKVRRKK